MKQPNGKYAWTVKVGEKGQFVIPKDAREIFGIEPGDTLLVLGDIKKGLAIMPKDKINKMASFLFGENVTDNTLEQDNLFSDRVDE